MLTKKKEEESLFASEIENKKRNQTIDRYTDEIKKKSYLKRLSFVFGHIYIYSINKKKKERMKI